MAHQQIDRYNLARYNQHMNKITIPLFRHRRYGILSGLLSGLLPATLLGGCVSSAGLAPHTHPIPLVSPTTAQINPQWWLTFHDAQLNQLMRTALQNAPDVARAQARIRVAEQEGNLARAQLNPSLALDGSATRQKFSAEGYFPPPIGGSTFNLGQVMADFSWDMDWWGKHRAVAQAALGSINAAQAEADDTRLALSIALARAYFALEADTEQHKRLAAMQATRNQLTGLLKERFASGLASEQRLPPSLSEQDKLDHENLVLENSMQQERLTIAALSGQPPHYGDSIHPHNIGALPTLPNDLPADLIGLRPDVQARRAEIEVATAQSRLAKIQFYPDVNLSGFIGLQSIGFANILHSDSEMTSIGPAVHLPIFNRNTIRATLGASYAQYDMAVEDYNQTIFHAMQETASALANLHTLAREEKTQRHLIHHLRYAQQLAEQRWQAGLDNNIPALQDGLAQQVARQTQTRIKLSTMNATLDVIHALGGFPAGIPTSPDNH